VQLGTFGAILKYGTEIEDAAAAYYNRLGAMAGEEARGLICDLANGSRKNRQTLERTRRMEMQEMILEAITGLDTVNYDFGSDPPEDFKGGVSKAVAMEQKASRFYTDAASKLGFLGNVKRTLEKLAKDREERSKKLQALS
jgi:rubrerythrin